MSEHTPINPNAPKVGASNARKITCEEWEAMLTDFLDGTLPESDTATFHAHEGSCDPCAEMFAQSSQGREWLTFLRTDPPVPPILISKILAQTSGAVSDISLGAVAVPVSSVVVPIPIAPVLPFWKRPGMATATRRVAQPRLMMTAAMAFFSITLTLNMAGVRLSTVRFADLRPAALSTNLDKQYHMASARVVRYYDNLRFVYEMEARVKELRRDADLENTAPADKSGQPANTTPPDGNHKSGGKSEGPGNVPPQPMLWGEKIEATLRNPSEQSGEFPSASQQTTTRSHERTTENSDRRSADQAERGIA